MTAIAAKLKRPEWGMWWRSTGAVRFVVAERGSMVLHPRATVLIPAAPVAQWIEWVAAWFALYLVRILFIFQFFATVLPVWINNN